MTLSNWRTALFVAGVALILGAASACSTEQAMSRDGTHAAARTEQSGPMMAGTATFELTAVPSNISTATASARAVSPTTATPTPTAAVPTPSGSSASTPLPTPTAPAPTPVAAPAGRVYAVGDSVMLGAAAPLQAAGVTVNAEVDRSWESGVAAVQAWSAQGIHPPVLVVHLGNNSAVSNGDVDAMMAAAGSAQVYFVLVYEPSLSAHAQQVNAVLAAAPGRYANAHLLNWPAVAASAVCSSDQIHISCGNGPAIYASFITSSVG